MWERVSVGERVCWRVIVGESECGRERASECGRERERVSVGERASECGRE